jgi:ketosteroid isomerase-like protein
VAAVAGSDVETIRLAFAAFERRDADGLLALCAPDVVFEPVTARLAGGGEAYRGHDGLRRYLEDVGRVWQELRPSPDAYHEGEDGIVVATGRVYAWGVGRVIDSPAGWLWRVQDGKIAYGRIFETASGALEAAGMGPAGRGRREP